MRTKYRQHLGKRRVVWFWFLGLLVAWWATSAKQVSTAFGENVWLLGLFVAGGLPTLSFLLFFLWLVRPAWLVVCLGVVCLLFALVTLGLMVALVGMLVWSRCCLVGWSVGWHSVDGWMHGWMDGSCAASRSRGVRVSFRRFPSFRTVSTQFPEGSEGLVTRSY